MEKEWNESSIEWILISIQLLVRASVKMKWIEAECKINQIWSRHED